MGKTREEIKAELMSEMEREIDSLLKWEDQTERVTVTDLEEKVLGTRRRLSERLMTELAQRRVEKLEAESRRRHVPACLFAGLHVALRDRDRAFEAFERSVEERDWRLLWIANDPDVYETLHDDPRWARLLERIGVPDRTGPLPERGTGHGGRS